MERYSNRVDDALALVTRAFRGRRRKGTQVPYLTHLLQVMVWVAEWGGDEEQMVAALLHDYLEDIEPGGAPELERRFGARVAAMVIALSELGNKRTTPWHVRKSEYIER